MKTKFRLHPDVLISLVTLIFAGILLFEIHTYPEEVRMFPSIFIYLFIVLMGITLVQGIMKTMHPEKADPEQWWCKWEVVRNPLITAAFVIIFVAMIQIVGFYIAAVLYLMISMYYFGSKKIMTNIMVTVILMVFCYLLFDMALSVSLPEGMLLEMLFG